MIYHDRALQQFLYRAIESTVANTINETHAQRMMGRFDLKLSFIVWQSEYIKAVAYSTLLYSWRFCRYRAPMWLLHGRTTSNNETVYRQLQ